MNTARPFFSIITPTYNRASYLSTTIKSVLAQSYKDYEHIIVDDGSTDNTQEIISNFTDQRLQYVWQSNSERSAARNHGIRMAKGEYILFLDSDDTYFEHHLELLRKKLEELNFPKGLIVFDCVLQSMDGEEKLSLFKQKSEFNAIENLLLVPLSPLRVCLPAEILKRFQFDEDISIVEDACLWMRVAQEYPIVQLSHLAGKYILHDNNSVSPTQSGALKRHKYLLRYFKRYPAIRQAIRANVYRDVMSRNMINISKYFHYKKSKLKSIYWAFKAICLAPIHVQSRYRVNIILAFLGLRKVPF